MRRVHKRLSHSLDDCCVRHRNRRMNVWSFRGVEAFANVGEVLCSSATPSGSPTPGLRSGTVERELCDKRASSGSSIGSPLSFTFLSVSPESLEDELLLLFRRGVPESSCCPLVVAPPAVENSCHPQTGAKKRVCRPGPRSSGGYC